jgi:hypothetical protein
VSPLFVGEGSEKFRNSRWQEMQSGHIFEEIEAFNWSKKCRFFRGIFVPLKDQLKKSSCSQNATKLELTDNA